MNSPKIIGKIKKMTNKINKMVIHLFKEMYPKALSSLSNEIKYAFLACVKN